MKPIIYFAGSIRGGRDDAELYGQLIQALKLYGQVLTEHIGDKSLTNQGEDGPTEAFIRDRDLGWLDSADVMVAEVTQPSTGVGIEIGKAEIWDKTILCIFRHQEGKRVSAMIAGSPQLTLAEYQDIRSAEKIFENFFANFTPSD